MTAQISSAARIGLLRRVRPGGVGDGFPGEVAPARSPRARAAAVARAARAWGFQFR